MDIEQLAGTKLGNYLVEGILGRGGMSVVYKGRQVNLDRPVALKILPPILSSDTSFIRRFKREARAVAKLSHPNIIQIFDISEEQNLHFFSMEYVEGQTLDAVLEEAGKLNPREAIRIVSQAALALEHAHKNNIIHRDVKPSNIIVDYSGNVKVMDFGLARLVDDRSKVTQSGALIGTLGYMSPEQCRGEELDFRTDIYSLGVILYEILTGKAPFDAPNEVAMIQKIINEEPAEAKRLNGNMSEDLSAIISRAMAKSRDARYQSFSEFLSELRALRSLTSSLSIEGIRSSPSIAVLPFVNMSADPDQEYFCDGLAEDIINALTQIDSVRVIARTSAFAFKGKSVKVQEIGKDLNVTVVLEGSVRKAGNRLRITCQLVDALEGHHIWSEQYNREMDDVFAIQDEITRAIVETLRLKLLREEKEKLVKRQTADLGAYNLYLRGRYFWSRRSEEGIKKAIECFGESIKRAPTYAPAYAGLADCHILSAVYELLSPREAYPKAREAALKALEIDDSLAEAHASLAQINSTFDWDWNNAERGFNRAIALSPGYATAHHWYAYYLMNVGRLEEALAEIELALEFDPFSVAINNIHGGILVNARQYDQAIEVLKKTIELDPGYAYAHDFLGMAYFLKGMFEEALTAFRKAEKLPHGWVMAKAAIAIVCAYTGKTDETRRILTDLLELRRKQYVRAFHLALVHLVLGEFEEGFKCLNNALEERDDFLLGINRGPMPDALGFRSDPRYLLLLKKMNLQI